MDFDAFSWDLMGKHCFSLGNCGKKDTITRPCSWHVLVGNSVDKFVEENFAPTQGFDSALWRK
jgi:hypothetical protein